MAAILACQRVHPATDFSWYGLTPRIDYITPYQLLVQTSPGRTASPRALIPLIPVAMLLGLASTRPAAAEAVGLILATGMTRDNPRLQASALTC
jgi:hypothetical protein